MTPIFGSVGNDTLVGGAGTDIIYGSSGDDKLIGFENTIVTADDFWIV